MAERFIPFLARDCPIKKYAIAHNLPGCKDECLSNQPGIKCPHTDIPGVFKRKAPELELTNPANQFVRKNLGLSKVIIYPEANPPMGLTDDGMDESREIFVDVFDDIEETPVS